MYQQLGPLYLIYIFRTSKGYFNTLELASRKKNCAKITDPNDPNFGMREKPEKLLAYVAGHPPIYFLANQIEVSVDN